MEAQKCKNTSKKKGLYGKVNIPNFPTKQPCCKDKQNDYRDVEVFDD